MATLGERIIEILGGITPAKLQQTLESVENRAYEQAYFDANDDPPSGDLANLGYKRMTANHLRDFSKASAEQILNTVWSLWQSSPIAKRLMTLKRDHIVGIGTAYETDDEDLQELLDTFTNVNDLENRVMEFALQLRLLGEQCYPAFVRETDGRVRLGYIDPSQIESVVTHPLNSMERWIVVTKSSGGIKNAYRIIREDREFVQDGQVVSPNYPGQLVTWEQTTIQDWELACLKDLGLNEYSGSVFFFPINCLSNQSRGVSDLVQVADWIDQADETLFALAEREQMAGYFSFDVTLTGADEAKVMARAKALRSNPPSKGSVNVHNDMETWQLHAPDLKQTGTVHTFVALLTFIMGGMGFPVAWYGYGDDTNRSTLQEQSTPSEKTLEHDQHQFESMMLFIGRFVKDQAEIAGTYSPPADMDNAIRYPLPAIRSEDLKGLTAAFAPMVAALMAAEDARMVSHATAARMAHQLLNEMGANIDTAQEMSNIEEEAMDSEQANNDTLAAMLNGQRQPVANGS